jgi:nitroimidazol reductase NimA-like FMN-containing flavoprotein (pyridoxamine 5'-phosphate oxidase superfamily)
MTSAWGRTEKLEPKECLALLSSVRVGRVGWSGPLGPQVLPVNHRVLDGAVVFRTDLYSAIADGTREGVAAFEADELEDRMQSGWSVLVVGRSEHLEDPAEIREVFRRLDEPWAPGSRQLVVRIVPAQVSGRRFLRH